jgi:hypothetical protein
VVCLRVAIICRELLAQPADILLDRVDQAGLVFLDGSADLKYKSRRLIGEEGRKERTLGRTKRVLNLENTRNISCALRAVASLSRSREMIWFSILATRSLYAVSAVYQISEPSAAC